MKNVALGLFAMLLLVGCPKKPTIKPIPPKPPEVEKPTPEKEKIEVPTPAPTIEKPKFPTDFSTIPEIQTVYFEFDKYDLTTEARDILAKNAEFLKDNPELEILVEGHCCECGTNEYNLGLGDKRANVVKEYYVLLGIQAEKISTISYGEEKPVYPGVGPPDSPLCAKNRRAETKVKIGTKVEK